MRKEALIISLLIVFAGSVTANEAFYELDVGEDEIMMNTTVRLECGDEQCPHNWRLSWAMPEDGKLLSIEDSRGPIEDYDIENGGIVATSNEDSQRDPETFKMRFRIDREAEEIHKGLYKREFSLRSFEGAKTSGQVNVDDFLSSSTSYGVESSITGNNLSFRSEGPLNLRVKFGKGNSTEYYEFFGGRPENSSRAFEVAVGTTGEQLKVKRLPVALLPGDVFNETVSKWSSGEYVSGSAKMRQGLEDRFLPVLAHETVHALNDRKLGWDSTSSSYFEEGTSTHIQYLVKKKLYGEGETDRPPRELFGESVRYDPDPTDNYYSTLPSKGSGDVLWGYYQNDEDFMKQWNPFDSRPEYRDFGYAYSELMIKNHLATSNQSLRDLYREINVDREITDPEEKWSLFSDKMDTTPCKYEQRGKFNECLEKVNNYNYTVYSAKPVGDISGDFTVEKLEVPERKQEKKNQSEGLDLELNNRNQTGSGFSLDSVIEALNSFVRKLTIFSQTSLQ